MEYNRTYERIVPKKCVGRFLAVRILAYLGYVCFALLWVAPIIRSLFSPVWIVLATLLTTILILCTRSYLHVEYEYAFVEDTLTVSKIFSKKRRKTMLTLELSKLLLVAPNTNDYASEIDRLAPTKTVSALASPDSENALAAVFDEGKDRRLLLLLESDERTVAFFRRHAPHACARELRSNLR